MNRYSPLKGETKDNVALPLNSAMGDVIAMRELEQRRNERRLIGEEDALILEENPFINQVVEVLRTASTKMERKSAWVKKIRSIGFKRIADLAILAVLSRMTEKANATKCSSVIFAIIRRLERQYELFTSGIEIAKLKTLAWNLIHALREAQVIELYRVGRTSEDSHVMLRLSAKTVEVLKEKGFSLRDPVMRPMLYRPVEHEKSRPGGMLTSMLRRTVKDSMRLGVSEQLVEALNNLQNTKWVINPKVWEVVTSDIVFGDDSTDWSELPAPISQTLYSAKELMNRRKDDPDDNGHFYHAWMAGPRGRLYTLCPWLSPQGGDLSRGLICFDQPMKVNKKAKGWIKCHVADLFKGVEGFTTTLRGNPRFSEMHAWFDENRERIFDVGRNPLHKRNIPLWWNDRVEGEHPYGVRKKYFQRIAAAYDAWMAFEETGKSSIAIQQDGTCNGQQHCAALMRDSGLAEFVDLVENYTKKDFYVAVAENAVTLWDSGDVDHKFGEYLSENSAIFSKRSFAKIPVMVLGYGISIEGLAKEIFDDPGKEWENLAGEGEEDDWIAHPGEDSILNKIKLENPREYISLAWALAKDYHRAFAMTVENAGQVRKILQQCTSSTKTPLEWSTGAGITVSNRYNRKLKTPDDKSHQYRASPVWKEKSHRTIRLARYDENKFDGSKMRQSIAPNFVHSLDASHMIMAINSMAEKGINYFHMVHDSFATHAANIELMRDAVRSTFVELHRGDPLARIAKSYDIEISGRGDFDIERVLNSKYMIH
jgi:DNA-directed RNA polymerase